MIESSVKIFLIINVSLVWSLVVEVNWIFIIILLIAYQKLKYWKEAIIILPMMKSVADINDRFGFWGWGVHIAKAHKCKCLFFSSLLWQEEVTVHCNRIQESQT